MRLFEGINLAANTHFSTTGKTRPGGSERIPFAERPTCSVAEAVEASGLGRSTIYDLMRDGQIEWTKVRTRRLVRVPSLLKLLGTA